MGGEGDDGGVGREEAKNRLLWWVGCGRGQSPPTMIKSHIEIIVVTPPPLFWGGKRAVRSLSYVLLPRGHFGSPTWTCPPSKPPRDPPPYRKGSIFIYLRLHGPHPYFYGY